MIMQKPIRFLRGLTALLAAGMWCRAQSLRRSRRLARTRGGIRRPTPGVASTKTVQETTRRGLLAGDHESGRTDLVLFPWLTRGQEILKDVVEVMRRTTDATIASRGTHSSAPMGEARYIWFVLGSAVVLASFAAGDPPQLDQRLLQDLRIGPIPTGTWTPGSIFQLQPGESLAVQLVMPTADAPFYNPVKADVAWSIEPKTDGVLIGARSGKIQVDSTVSRGTVVTIRANIEKGRRVLDIPLYVFTSAASPLLGGWTRETLIACADGHEIKPTPNLNDQMSDKKLFFYANGAFEITTPFPFGFTAGSSGDFEYDAATRRLSLRLRGRNNQGWKCNARPSDVGRKLTLKPLRFGGEDRTVCGYVLRRLQESISPHGGIE
jgi:hypothetical protein